MIEMKFNLGDAVEIVDDVNGHGFPIGTIVTITHKGHFFDYGADREGMTWYFDEKEIAQPKVKNDKTMKQMKKAVESMANDLLKANNTVTTLEIKTALRKTHPHFYWIQNSMGTIPGVSEMMDELSQEGKFVYTDNGTYRIYSHAGKKRGRPVTATKVTIQPKRTTKVKKTKSTKGISTHTPSTNRRKALDMMRNNRGHFFTATFIKKDGTTRTINCQYMASPKDEWTTGYVKVRESAKMKTSPTDSIRQINLNTLKELKIAGKVYKVRK